MSVIRMSKGNIKMTFFVFNNGNAIYMMDGEPVVIEDFAEKFIQLCENGFERER